MTACSWQQNAGLASLVGLWYFRTSGFHSPQKLKGHAHDFLNFLSISCTSCTSSGSYVCESENERGN